MGYGNGSDYAAAQGFTGTMQAQMGSAIATPRVPAISQQSAVLEKRVEQLHNTISELEQRLSGITMPDGPSAVTGGKPVDSHSPVALAQHLGTMNDRLDQAVTRLSSLLNRIEL